MQQTSPLVITISRQLGSGGAYIGQRLAKNLNCLYADREIISQAAQQLSVLKEDVESRDEKILSFWQSFIQSFAITPDAYIPPQIKVPTERELFETESEIISGIAKERSAVILGRCGFYILREHPNHISIFLHGDITFRKGRIQKFYDASEENAEKMIAQNDMERAHYNHKFTGKEWTDARQYDISINTGKMGVDKSVELILQYVKLI
jgi:CMP/dCMP kinase